jgi:hypothetical protein
VPGIVTNPDAPVLLVAEEDPKPSSSPLSMELSSSEEKDAPPVEEQKTETDEEGPSNW